MLTVVLDTNVLASGAVAKSGTMTRIVDAWQDGVFRVIISTRIYQELTRTLEKPYFVQRLGPELITEYLTLVRETTALVSLGTPVLGVATHPEDDFILATAIAGQANILVMGDGLLQKLGHYEGVRILSPRAFHDELEVSGLILR